MFANYLKIALRRLLRQRGYSVITVAGLALGLACFILVLLWVLDEFSYDRFNTNADRIYRVAQRFDWEIRGSDTAPITPAPLAAAMEENFPEVLVATKFAHEGHVLIRHGDNCFYEDDVIMAEPALFEIFDFELIAGQPAAALENTYSVILSESMARKYFGQEDPLGKTIRYEGTTDLTVTGILRDVPRNSHLIPKFILPFSYYALDFGGELDNWGMSSFLTYFLLQEGADPAALEAKFPDLIQKYAEPGNEEHDSYFLEPLLKIHLYTASGIDVSPRGSIQHVYLFSCIGFLILLIACINYMNLATARYSMRAREVGIRKVVGAQRAQLIRQFLGESVTVTLAALVLALVLVEMTLPTLNQFTGKEIHIDYLHDFKLVGLLLALAVIVSLLAGSYPAFLLSSFRPASMLGKFFFARSGGLRLRNILVVLQFTISIVLIVSTFVVRGQLQYIRHKDPGYAKDQILFTSLYDRSARRNVEALKNELLTDPNISLVAASSSLPNHLRWLGRARYPGRPEDFDLHIYVGLVDYDFVDLYEMDIVEGRNFSREFPSDANGAFLLNESAVKALGWDDPVGREFTHWSHSSGLTTAPIVGVVKDFHIQSLHHPIDPLYLFLDPRQDYFYLSVKLRGGGIAEGVEHVRRTLKQFMPEYPFEYQFFDDYFNQEYQAEQKTEQLFSFLAGIAILLACLGLVGLASFSTERRIKEIGIRKVLGASVTGIVSLLTREFLLLVAISALVAVPVAWVAMSRWLERFTYRIDMGVGFFLLAGGLTLLVALLTVSFHAVRAGLSDPVKSLRYE